MLAGCQKFQREIPVDDRIQRIGHGAVKAQRLCRHLAVNRERCARQGRSPQRRGIHPLARIGKARPVAGEHFHIGHHVMAPCHRLGGLQMGKAGHDPIGPRLGLPQQAPACKAAKCRIRLIALIAHPEPEIDGHLIIARPRRVQPPCRLRRSVSRNRASTFMWMSSSAVENGNSPVSISDNTVSRPSRIASASLSLMMPVAANMAAWAREPAMSCGASRRSYPIEALIASMIASGPAAKRPPHIVFADLVIKEVAYAQVNISPALYGPYAVLQTLATPIWPTAEALREGDMRKLNFHSAPVDGSDVAFTGADGQEMTLADYQRQIRGAEFLGHMVRALPQGNAASVSTANRDGRRPDGGRDHRHGPQSAARDAAVL